MDAIGVCESAWGDTAVVERRGFVVKGTQGPLRAGEHERARACGERLAAEVERRRHA